MEQTITQNQEIENSQESSIHHFLKKFRIGSFLNRSHFIKTKGSSNLMIFKFLFSLVYKQKPFSMLLASNQEPVPFKKDVIYRFLNSLSYNWEKFLSLLSEFVIKKFLVPLTNQDRVNVLIIDDSLVTRDRSKKVELLSRVFDHITNTYKKGFRLLTLGWSDGNTFIPLTFNLLASAKNRNLLAPVNEKIDKRTNAGKRRALTRLKATDALIELIKTAIKYSIPAKIVLFDSWFSYPSILKKILQLKKHVIARLKAHYRVFYKYDGRSFTLVNLYAYLKKKRGRAKIITSAVVQIGKHKNNKPIKAKIVFVREKHNKRNWAAFISTDFTLDDSEIIRIYGKRWSIEVFFKVCKSYLALAQEFQGRSYDQMVAQTTLVFTRYLMLAMNQRDAIDEKTIGELFHCCIDEIADIKFLDALKLIFQLLKNWLKKQVETSDAVINALLDEFINSLPPYFRPKIRLVSCET